MKKRNPIVVLALPFATCGVYSIFWFVTTKGEMKKMGADIPTAWLLLIPFANLYWFWKWAKGVEKVSGFSSVGAFLLCLFLAAIGMAIVQMELNKVAA